MNQQTTPQWTLAQHIAFRSLVIYLLLYVILCLGLSDNFPLVKYLYEPLHSAFLAFTRFVFQIFFHRQFKGKPMSDSYLTCTALLSLFIIAAVISVV